MLQLIISAIIVIILVIAIEKLLNIANIAKDDKSLIRLSGIFIFIVLFLIEHT